MDFLQKVYCRSVQGLFRLALPCLPYREPVVLAQITDIPWQLKTCDCTHPLLITGPTVRKLGLPDALCDSLRAAGNSVTLFDQVQPNPTSEQVELAVACYHASGCDSLIAFGGGSPMDCAKAAGARIVRPDRSLAQLSGLLKVRRSLPPLLAIPTTAGTGSETTLAAVITDAETRHKFVISDFSLIPRYAVLDPATIHTLPSYLVAATGMDALTHAIEAYIGRSTTRETRDYGEQAVKRILTHLSGAVAHELESERAMLHASYLAGQAFTRSYVGYVHAVSHSLSGKYDLPHGETNAILLPRVLRRYGSIVIPKLARLARIAALGSPSDSDAICAERLIRTIEEMDRSFGIPETISVLQPSDIPDLAHCAHREANPLYPVPVLWNAKELEEIYRDVLP